MGTDGNGRQLTPLLLIAEPLNEHQPKFNGNTCNVGAREVLFELDGEQQDVRWRGQKKEQDALDERYEGQVKEVE